jgi:hypothetical protein
MKRLLIALPALLLSACVILPVPVPLAASSGLCRDEGLARYADQPASPQLGAEMQRASGARVLQWVGPDMAVTMDHRPDRLQVNLDRNGRVQSARCG